MIFILGVITGLLLRDIKCGCEKGLEKIEKTIRSKEKAQFLEPITVKEKFEKAKTIDDIL